MLLPVAKIRAAIFFLILPAFLLIINRKWIAAPTHSKRLENKKLWVSLKACDCQKDTGIPAPYSVKPTLVNDTTCSEEAFLLGGGQRVVSFVYYEGVTYDTVRRRDFFSGVEANAEAIAGLLPGNFRMRLYYQMSSNSSNLPRLCRLACGMPNLDICDVEKNPKSNNVGSLTPHLWRVLPVLDPQVSLLFSRDLDSVVSAREAAAVAEFLRHPNATVHIMRDHRGHRLVMLGGTWGAKLEHPETRRAWIGAFHDMTKDRLAYSKSPHNYNADQKLLERRREKEDCNFVGAQCARHNGTGVKSRMDMKCPEECRKEPSWEQC